MTQLEYARRGLITEKMKLAAIAEGVSPEFVRDGIAAGTIVICHNIKHLNGIPLPVGAGLRTKVNANIGSSSDDTDMQKELEKARAAVKYGADAMMDLSTGGPVDEIRRAIIAETSACIGVSAALPGRPGCGSGQEEGHRRYDGGRHLCRNRQACRGRS